MRAASAILMLVFSTAAHTQITTTNCGTVGNTVQCQTYGSPAPAPAQPSRGFNAMEALGAFEAGQRQRLSQQQEEALRRQEFERHAQEYARKYPTLSKPAEAAPSEAEQRALGKRAGELVLSGDCPGAIKLALEAGNFELAGNVKQYWAK